MNWKVGAAVVAAIAAIAMVSSHVSSSGRSYHASVEEYNCNVGIANDPKPIMKEVSGTVDIKCSTAPRTTALTVMLQYRAKDSAPWQNAGPTKVFVSTPTSQTESINISQPCSAGSWRVGYEFDGTGAGTGKAFTTAQAFGSSQSISTEQCANS